jgi:adenylosuccinate synthase
MKAGKLNVIIDNAWGSCGKGNIEAFLAKNHKIDLVTSMNSMNSGHQFKDDNGEVHTCKMLPVAGVLSPKSIIVISSGQAICIERLMGEIEEYGVGPERLMISPTAVIINQYCKDYEAEHLRYIASTMQGTGAAQALKAMRSPKVQIARDVPELQPYVRFDIPEVIMSIMQTGGVGLVEIPQGIGLSVDNGRFYPMVTSRPINVAQAFAYLDVPVSLLGDVIGLARTYPIRVGNVEGGYSGDVYQDSKELSWEEISKRIGRPVKELTTVTKRVRRVFEFSKFGFQMGVKRNGINVVFLTFVDYLRDDERETMKEYLLTKFNFDEVYFVSGFGDFDNTIKKIK